MEMKGQARAIRKNHKKGARRQQVKSRKKLIWGKRILKKGDHQRLATNAKNG